MPILFSELQAYVGRSISDICTNGFSAPSQNHCAHFVSHALGISLGMLCGDMAYKTRKAGVSIRCDELFNRLGNRGPWEKRPAILDGILVFVTSARNVRDNVMLNVPQKHVGIHYGGGVYNFSNSQHKVVVDPTIESFHEKFKRIYAGGDISLFYGVVQ